jgi:transcriptional regulator CtsR
MSNFQYNNNTYIFQQQIYPGKQQQNQPYMSNYYPQQDFNNYLRYNQYPQYEHNDNYGRFGGLDKQILDLSYADLNELLLHLIDLCKDHNGSRLVQKKYEEGSEEERSLIFDKLFPCIASLSKDQFGNYVIQKLFECSDNKKRKMMIAQLEGIVFELTLDTYGCRVVQKAIDVIEIEDVRKLLSEIKKDIKKCIEDQNGNHAIQKLVEKLPKGEHKEILKFVFGRVMILSYFRLSN